MKTITVEVPYPDGALLQNSRKHWTVKKDATAEARMVARSNAQTAMGVARWTPAPLTGVVTIWPPDRRRRDAFNTGAALKPAIDGIFDALGVDDFLVDDWRVQRREPVPGGRVVIQIFEKCGE